MPVKNPARLADALKAKLEEKSWSQKQLAAHLERDNSTVSLWVSGRQAPRVEDADTISRLARFLETAEEHVRSMVTAQKLPQSSDTLPARQRIRRLEDLRLIFANNAYLEESLSLRLGRVGIAGLRNRLLEEGYDVSDEVLKELRSAAQDSPPARPRARSGISFTLGSSQAAAPQLEDSTRNRDAVRLACRRLNADFAEAGNKMPSTVFHQVVERAASEVLGGDLASPVVAFIRKGCLDLRLVKELPSQEFQRLWPISAEYLMNKHWGFRSGIQNFDFLLDGGWLPPAESGCPVILKGLPGRGKTMFALQTAAAFAQQGNVAIYFSAEEPASQMLSRLSYAGFTTRRLTKGWQKVQKPIPRSKRQEMYEFDLLTTNDLEDDVLEEIAQSRNGGDDTEPERGCLVIVEVPEKRGFFRPQSRLLLQLESIMGSNLRKGRYTLTAFDSVDALDPGLDRRAFERLVNLARRPQSITLMITENHGGRPNQFREHLADVVIRFDVREGSERVLEIEKCRTQSQVRGQHMFAIHGDRGMTVYPSLRGLLSVWRRRIRTVDEARPVVWSVDGLDIGEKLSGDFIEGASALLSGPPHTHKLLLGLSFLASEIRSGAENRVVLISLREDAAEIVRIIRSHPQLHPLLDPREPDGLNPRFEVRYFPPDYFQPNRFVHWMQELFRDYEARQDDGQHRISRIVVNTLAQLLHNSPMVDQEALFVDALIELFKRKRATSLFLSSGDDPQQAMYIFEVLLFTGREKSDGRQVATFRVGHSGPCNAPDEQYVIRRERNESGARLFLEVDRDEST
jgi:KaiC/GvpD/RAD55 family RecA-like ATPase/transcriptional regulator with XRE-family HTH domain